MKNKPFTIILINIGFAIKNRHAQSINTSLYS